MEEDGRSELPENKTPMTDEEIIAATVGERPPLNRTIDLVAYDPAWPSLFHRLEEGIRRALGDGVLLLEHVGSTSVPGLAAKPVIDVVLAVANSSDELSYVEPLVEEGFTLRIREPEWHEHRMLIPPEIPGHVHVFSEGCEEIERMLLFRDRLRSDVEDRLLYAKAKRELAARTWKYTQNYADAKSEIIRMILLRTGPDKAEAP